MPFGTDIGELVVALSIYCETFSLPYIAAIPIGYILRTGAYWIRACFFNMRFYTKCAVLMKNVCNSKVYYLVPHGCKKENSSKMIDLGVK